MNSVKSHEFRKEEERLEYTKGYIKKTLEATEIYKSQYKENIQEAMENLDYLDSSQSYISVLINTQFMETAGHKKYFKDYHQKTLANNQVELEDLAPMAYLKKALFGFKENITVGNIVIEEAQDFSLLEIKVLKELLKTDKFTLLGDLSQGIHSYRSIDNWTELTQSYRTTIEIMDLANEVIDFLDNQNVKKAKPVIRHGDAPKYEFYEEEEAMIQGVTEEILALQRDGRKSIAVICKDREESIDLKKKLPKAIKTVVLKEDQNSYGSGVTIVPSYLVKGLEFDSVIICNQNSYYEENPIDIKLLYVAITRGMHTLSIFEGNQPDSLLRKIYQRSESKSLSA